MSPNLFGNDVGRLYISGDSKSNEPMKIISPTDSKLTNGQSVKPNETAKTNTPYKIEVVWKNVLIFVILHYFFLHGFYLMFSGKIKWQTYIFTYLYAMWAGFGITAGAHRLWAHRAYTANLPLRIFLMLGQSAAVQNDIFVWVRDHRVHHKFTDTNADPHNASRGFFFSHIGWLLCKKHEDVMVKGKTVDMGDVLADPVVRFQIKCYIPLTLLMMLIIPTLIPWYFWNQTLWTSFVASLTRYTFSLNGTWLVNSAAHIWGMKPYDKTIKPTENKMVSALAFGEGWHNYHHIFPWDYKAAELGNYNYNFTTCFLDIMSKIGWATELKTASEDMIRKRILRTGDGSRKPPGKSTEEEENQPPVHSHEEHGELVWGWGDKDMDSEEIKEIRKVNRMKA